MTSPAPAAPLSLAFDHPHERPADELAELLGGKGAGLSMMAGELGLPVPPGFTLTTDACRLHAREGWTDALEAALEDGLTDLEARLDRRLGDPHAPLLLSVRSGAPVSMPGMMDTVLNVGLDAAVFSALEAEAPDFARDCRTRLAASYQESVGPSLPDEVRTQLREAVRAVFRSADSPRARSYRRKEGLSGEPTTAVNIQTMVFGNRDDRSATGVIFSRDPSTGEPGLYGDLLFQAQGEDVVSGRHTPRPIRELAARLPRAHRALATTATQLEHRLRDLCEIEFTIEREHFWLLQVRVGKRSPRAALRIAAALAEEPNFPLERKEAVERVRGLLADPPRERTWAGRAEDSPPTPIARGLAASPGLVAGEVFTDLERAIDAAEQGRDVLLCRPETSPADVAGIQVARGLMTARGGFASHAAVVARGWGLPAVVGVETLTIAPDEIRLGPTRIACGEPITIDGSSGEVYAGALDTREQVVPEARPLLDWAAALGMKIDVAPEIGISTEREATRAPEPAEPSPAGDAVTRDDVIQALAIRGAATPESIAESTSTGPAALEALFATLEGAGLIEPAKPLGFRLTEAGQVAAKHLLDADRTALGIEVARAALLRFQTLDTEAKQAVTDWQMRPVQGELAPNDHTDPVWDGGVFDRLDQLVNEADAWLADLIEALPRLAHYVTRLRRAQQAAAGGDGRFVASPRVDSLHGAWFELHEDLIRLADSSRREELEAGRAG
jgi:pyruvate,orthophosphate dikinase